MKQITQEELNEANSKPMPENITVRIYHCGDCPIKVGKCLPSGSFIFDQVGHCYDLHEGGFVKETKTRPFNSTSEISISEITIELHTKFNF